MTSPCLNVGLIGLGTVGGGVARILTEHAERITRRAGRQIAIRKVAVRDLSKTRVVNLPDGTLTTSIDDVINDPEIEVVLQLMGGISPARETMQKLLQAGKHVVTANKALLCEHGSELFQLATEHDCCIAYEAAVAGGIPIISVINQSMAANQITSIEAILNGTSNFILTEMLARNSSYETILSLAQERGYAEADPTMDIDGTDAAQKLVLLTQLAFGTKVRLDDFPRQGITTLELSDLKYADELGYTVKLLAVTRLIARRLELHVQPTLVRHERALAQIHGPYNMIALVGDAVGTTHYSGQGAGQMPTASAVVADLIDVAVGRAQLTFRQLPLGSRATALPVVPPEDTIQRYYLRFNALDRPHVFADITDILGRHGISLASVIQHEAPELDDDATDRELVVPIVVMTHRTTEGRIRAAEAELHNLRSLRPPVVRMSISDA